MVLGQQVTKLQGDIEKLKVSADHKYQALQNFLTLLVNFASHDIKNAIHSMDGIVSTIDGTDIKASDIDTMKICLDNIRNTLEKFSDFNLNSKVNRFEIGKLFSSLEILNRPFFKSQEISYSVHYQNVSRTLILEHDFHIVLYMLINLTINSTTALLAANPKAIEIRLKMNGPDTIKIYFGDNGCGVPEENRDKIFKPYFTTKEKGTGVGLTHVLHVLDTIKGSISLASKNDFGMNTVFELTIPLGANDPNTSH